MRVLVPRAPRDKTIVVLEELGQHSMRDPKHAISRGPMTLVVAAWAVWGSGACHSVYPFRAVTRSDSGSAGDAARADGAQDGAREGGWFDAAADRATVDGKPKDGPPSDGNGVPGTWAAVPAATFTMGSPPSEPCRFSSEEQHPVTLTHDFEIQTTEVTQEQFQSLMGRNPARFSSCGSNCPVEQVSWHEAAAYCNAVSQRAGKTPCYSCNGSGVNVTCADESAYSGQKIYTCPGYRLPTEAEWEHAYRAGTTATYYSGSSEESACVTCYSIDANADKIGWYCANSADTTHPVGSKQANAWGLQDMAGNVWEWCHDWYQASLGSSSAIDPWGAPSAPTRVLRGGAWNVYARNLRAANRNQHHPPNARWDYLGFRCCRSLTP